MTYESANIQHPKLTLIRELVARLPEAVEIETWGHPTFRAGKKMFAAFGSKNGQTSMSVKATKQEQADALDSDSGCYYVPDYVGKHGWLGIFVDEVDWETIESMLIRGYRQQALKRMLKALDNPA